jgi:hypothetical protein
MIPETFWVIGTDYAITHTRKGIFRARVLGTKPTKDGDPADVYWLHVEINTARGSGHERLANAVIYINGVKQPAATTEKRLRPSLITDAVEVTRG